MMSNNWQNVDNAFEGNSLKANDMAVGESLIGTVTAIDPSQNYEGAYFLFLQTDKGITRVFTSGNLSYKVKDGKIQVGNTYKITRMEDTPAKKKGAKPRSTFNVQVDADTAKKALPAI